MEKLKLLYARYKHGWLMISYLVFYLVWFFYLERRIVNGYQVIHMAIDDYIPFVEAFVIPYFLWFGYVSVTVLYFFFKNKEDYFKTCAFLFTGMTIFLIISTLFPNGHHLRPLVMPRDNIFTQMIAALYHTDTATNLWPSIHVYNSLGVHFAIIRSKEFADKKEIRFASLLLAGSIVLSTVFIKQHSMFDVLTAFGLAAVMYLLVYRVDVLLYLRTVRERIKPQIS